MSLLTGLDRRPWPDAPRPYPEEPLGGWVGRIAYRYRIPVADLLTARDCQAKR
jgi:hypothetical protein